MLVTTLTMILTTALLALGNPVSDQYINYSSDKEINISDIFDELVVDLIDESSHSNLGERDDDIVHMKVLPVKAYISANKYYDQRKNYPHGCEMIALINSMLRLEIDPNVPYFYNWYLIKEDFNNKNGVKYGPDPELQYAGDPTADKGFYCFEQVIIRSGNHYLLDQNSQYRLKDITGSNTEEIKTYISEGFPVVFWALLDFSSEPQYTKNGGWYINETNKFYTPYSNLHCMVAVGYDDREGFKICDSLASTEYWVPYNKFIASVDAIGNRMITYYVI